MATDRKGVLFKLPAKTRGTIKALAARWRCNGTDVVIHCVDVVAEGDFPGLERHPVSPSILPDALAVTVREGKVVETKSKKRVKRDDSGEISKATNDASLAREAAHRSESLPVRDGSVNYLRK